MTTKWVLAVVLVLLHWCNATTRRKSAALADQIRGRSPSSQSNFEHLHCNVITLNIALLVLIPSSFRLLHPTKEGNMIDIGKVLFQSQIRADSKALLLLP